MYKYLKHLNYPINLKKKDLKMAKLLLTQLGGPNGELAASLRYFCQKFHMPDDKGKALLNDIATEELGHVEMISTMIYQLVKDASLDELKKYDLECLYTEHGKGIYPSDSFGNPFTVTYLAAEEKARATYEHLIDISDDEDIIDVLLFLRQREIVHFARFKELYDYYKNKFKS